MLRVLFVCTGNICRSPLAEAFLVDRARPLPPGLLDVRSAGTWGRAGHPAMPDTIRAGAERGLDLEGHGASALRPDAVDRADLVLAMTEEHVEEILRISPEAAPRTFTLKELAHLLGEVDVPPPRPDEETARAGIAAADDLRRSRPAGRAVDPDVADPIGLGPDVYRAIAAEIEGAVDVLVAGLFGVAVPAGAREEA